MTPDNLLTRMRRVKLLALDVDGVLTDGALYMGDSGEMQKKFTSQDGYGLKRLIDSGVKVALISGLAGQWIIDRFGKLGIVDFHMGLQNKADALDELLKKYALTDEQVAYMGDDVIDLPVLSRVGLAVGVPNGLADVNRAVHMVTRLVGGEGAVREVCDLLLRYRNRTPRTLGVIPVRMESSRFPGKPLIDLLGKPLFTWVYDRARSVGLDELVVATDSPEIMKVCGQRGIPVVRTDTDHRCGTDRVAKVAEERDADIIVNIQGDEPMVEPRVVNSIVDELIRRPEIDIVTACVRLEDVADVANENVVKVVRDRNGFALYFSRLPIPLQRDPRYTEYLKHIGVYGFQREALLRFAACGLSQLESAEGLEQLRALENGLSVRVLDCQSKSLSVNTPEDLRKVAELLRREGVE
jgi:3-deoxy-manno-octulosonate cytidylyltransferase (CMP-KDO synthetase)